MKSEIIYEIRGDVADISAFRLGGSLLSLSFPTYGAGHLTLGGFSVPVADGRAELDCSLMSDGEYRPILLADGRQIRLERFAVEDGRLAILPTEEATLRELLRRTRRLELLLHSFEEKLTALGEKVSSDTIF